MINQSGFDIQKKKEVRHLAPSQGWRLNTKENYNMMDYGELRLSPERAMRNPINGQFLKGLTPHNKGKKWSEYLTKRQQKRCAKGWKNLEIYRPKHRPDTAGRCKKPVIAVFDDGKFRVFPSIRDAADSAGALTTNLARCYIENRKRHINRKTGKVNTDHKYFGVRWYYESDNIWTTKITQ